MTSPWRDDPDLRARLHPQHPDDLQVLVHVGEPRRTQRVPEGCWLRLDAHVGTLVSPSRADADAPVERVERPVYAGTLLHDTKQLPVAKGDRLLLVHAPGMPLPVVVTEAYRAERPQWSYVRCSKCGADQSLDAPTTMARTRFPAAPAGSVPISFTAFCPCSGTMVLSLLDDEPPAPGPTGKPWWKFW